MRAALLIAFAIAAAAQNPTGAISGTVVDSVTRQPVKQATINLSPLNNGPNAPSPGVSTDATGAFSIQGLAEGRWYLSATQPNYPQTAPRPQIVDVKAGDTATVTLELTPGAVVTGHVVDEDGDPLMGCFVTARAAGNDQQRGGSSASCDGEYRIHNLPAGKYIFSAMCYQPPFTPRPLSAGADPPPSLGYPEQYYPLAPDAKSAQAVELAAGAEKSDVDFQMRPAPVTQVRGSFSPSGADWHSAPNIAVGLIPVGSPNQGYVGRQNFDREKGTFEFSQVFPGSYYLTVFPTAPGNPVGAFERIEVKDRPVQVVLQLAHSFDISGTVTIERDSSKPVALNHLRVQLISDIPPGGFGANPAEVGEDGAFTIRSVMAAPWRVGILGPGVFLKSAWLGSTDVTHSAFDLSPGAGPLRIVASANMGMITGTAPPGMKVYARLEQAITERMFGIPVAMVDQTGHFVMGSVPPGTYRAGAIDINSPIPEDGGQEVTVHEGETVTVEVKPPEQ